MKQSKKYRVEVKCDDGLWHLDSEQSTKRQAERRFRDMMSWSYDPARILSPAGNVIQESYVTNIR